MFKLFKKNKTDNQQEIIAAIHNEFDVAGEKLLAEAREIIEADIDTSKGERLVKLGFIRSSAAVDAKTVTDMKVKNLEIAERVEYFRTYYPSYKFITEEMVEAICKKYGLLCGSVSIYIGGVPEKNIKEIEKFILREEDFTRHACNHYIQTHTFYGIVPLKTKGSFYGYFTSNGWFNRVADESQTHHLEKAGLKICAPVKDFNTDYMRIEKGYSLQNIPDPVVLQPVKGGYLVVSKWGLEGQDESLTNETSN